MKSLKESIFGDVKDIVSSDIALIEPFINDNYEIDGTYTIKDGVVNVKGNVFLKNDDIKSLTNGTFRFGTVDGYFLCYNRLGRRPALKGTPNLVSLEDGPEKVGGNFWCDECDSLTVTPQDRKKYKIQMRTFV